MSEQHDAHSLTVFGFWVYLLTDFMMFGALFATYAVFQSAHPPFDVRLALCQTLVLLGAAFAGSVAMVRGGRASTLALFGVTFVLGALFLAMEVRDLTGVHWQQSAYWSAYLTLIGTHALHVAIGLLWIPVLLIPVWREGLTPVSVRRLTCLGMFWQFVNVVWVLIFGIVYLMGRA